MLTIAGIVVKYLRYWKTALKNRAFRCCFQREGDGESPSAGLSAASLERPRESAAGASRYRSAEICASIIRVVPRPTSPLSWGRGFLFCKCTGAGMSPRLPFQGELSAQLTERSRQAAARSGSPMRIRTACATSPTRLRRATSPLRRGGLGKGKFQHAKAKKFNVYRRSIHHGTQGIRPQ